MKLPVFLRKKAKLPLASIYYLQNTDNDVWVPKKKPVLKATDRPAVWHTNIVINTSMNLRSQN